MYNNGKAGINVTRYGWRSGLLTAAGLTALFLSFGNAPARANESATLYRDEWGIPHVYAPDLATASYALGYAQAEDRLEELLLNYRRANGTVSEVLGASHFAEDHEQKLYRHAEIARAKYSQISPEVRQSIESYQAGVRKFMKDHPEQVPAWAQEIHPWDVIALGRYIIWGWPLGEAEDDLEKVSIRPDVPPEYHGSNEMLIAPKRTSIGAPLAVIDPHLTWYGPFRFYAERIYAGNYQVSGVCLLGMPLPTLGHSRWCSVAMTTGGPDTTDVYEEELNPANPHQYKYNGKWRSLKVWKDRIGVKVGNEIKYQEITLEASHHGPIMAHKNGKAYAMASMYEEAVGLADQSYKMMTAHNITEMKKALEMRQLMMQNVMVATIQGDIFYCRTGRVPVRAPGVDWTKPVPGNTSATEFRGLHHNSDMVQILNPVSGYMHNCNVTPAGMMKNSPLLPEKFAKYPYIYNATFDEPRHQRSEMMTELLDEATNVSVDKMIEIAFSSRVWHAELWQERLKKAVGSTTVSGDAGVILERVLRWNRVSSADSMDAMAFFAFKKGLPDKAMKATEPTPDLTDDTLVLALSKGAEVLHTMFGKIDVKYGDYFRIGREGSDTTYPASGGSLKGDSVEVGMATPHAISYGKHNGLMVGHGGQTATQIVAMTNPPQSWAILPLGESDHKESGHWDDQAEKLFSKGKAASTYFLNRKELIKHATSVRIIEVEN